MWIKKLSTNNTSIYEKGLLLNIVPHSAVQDASDHRRWQLMWLRFVVAVGRLTGVSVAALGHLMYKCKKNYSLYLYNWPFWCKCNLRQKNFQRANVGRGALARPIRIRHWFYSSDYTYYQLSVSSSKLTR